ncbi:MAG: putative peptidyl-tRNA hydrolase [Frankiales bacterium]|nr:putative peptidyl-tRNA hydrolase [Frankiales bacterium]
MADERYLVAGLGNPGAKYAGNRHNVGFLVADELAARVGGKFKVTKSQGGPAETVEGRLAGHPVVLVKPMSFMNTSGGPTAAIARFFHIPVERVIAVHDELDLPYGTLRLKRGGGEGGHNGLRSLTTTLGSKDYARIRFGIGRPPGRQDPADFVLRDFAAAERGELGFLIDRAADAIELLLTDGLDVAQNRYNST